MVARIAVVRIIMFAMQAHAQQAQARTHNRIPSAAVEIGQLQVLLQSFKTLLSSHNVLISLCMAQEVALPACDSSLANHFEKKESVYDRFPTKNGFHLMQFHLKRFSSINQFLFRIIPKEMIIRIYVIVCSNGNPRTSLYELTNECVHQCNE